MTIIPEKIILPSERLEVISIDSEKGKTTSERVIQVNQVKFYYISYAK